MCFHIHHIKKYGIRGSVIRLSSRFMVFCITALSLTILSGCFDDSQTKKAVSFSDQISDQIKEKCELKEEIFNYKKDKETINQDCDLEFSIPVKELTIDPLLCNEKKICDVKVKVSFHLILNYINKDRQAYCADFNYFNSIRKSNEYFCDDRKIKYQTPQEAAWKVSVFKLLDEYKWEISKISTSDDRVLNYLNNQIREDQRDWLNDDQWSSIAGEVRQWRAATNRKTENKRTKLDGKPPFIIWIDRGPDDGLVHIEISEQDIPNEIISWLKEQNYPSYYRDSQPNTDKQQLHRLTDLKQIIEVSEQILSCLATTATEAECLVTHDVLEHWALLGHIDIGDEISCKLGDDETIQCRKNDTQDFISLQWKHLWQKPLKNELVDNSQGLNAFDIAHLVIDPLPSLTNASWRGVLWSVTESNCGQGAYVLVKSGDGQPIETRSLTCADRKIKLTEGERLLGFLGVLDPTGETHNARIWELPDTTCLIGAKLLRCRGKTNLQSLSVKQNQLSYTLAFDASQQLVEDAMVPLLSGRQGTDLARQIEEIQAKANKQSIEVSFDFRLMNGIEDFAQDSDAVQLKCCANQTALQWMRNLYAMWKNAYGNNNGPNDGASRRLLELLSPLSITKDGFDCRRRRLIYVARAFPWDEEDRSRLDITLTLARSCGLEGLSIIGLGRRDDVLWREAIGKQLEEHGFGNAITTHAPGLLVDINSVVAPPNDQKSGIPSTEGIK